MSIFLYAIASPELRSGQIVILEVSTHLIAASQL